MQKLLNPITKNVRHNIYKVVYRTMCASVFGDSRDLKLNFIDPLGALLSAIANDILEIKLKTSK